MERIAVMGSVDEENPSPVLKRNVASGDTSDVAAARDILDFDDLLVQLEQLERREREVSLLRQKLHDRLNAFPNEVAVRQEAQVSAERRELHRQIDLLRNQLTPIRHQLEPEE